MRREDGHDMRKKRLPLFMSMFFTLLFVAMVGLHGCGGGGGNDSASASVSDSAKKIASFSVLPADNKWPINYEKRFEAYNVYTNNTKDASQNSSVKWSSDSAAVTITSDGMATASSAGTATITASSDDGLITGKTTLTVTVPNLPPSPPPLDNAPVDVNGIWKGTYKIDDAVDRTQLGTYTLKFELKSKEGIVTGSSSLRYYDSDPTPDQMLFNDSTQNPAVGQFLPKAISGNKIDLFTLKYIDPITKMNEMEDIVSALITGNVMTGEVQENLKDKWHCHYTFILKKQ